VSEHVPISDPGAEATVIRALQHRPPHVRREIVDALTDADFHGPDARRCFRSIADAMGRGTDLDAAPCQLWMLRNPRFEAATAAAEVTPWPDAVARVRAASMRRRTQRAALLALEAAEDQTADADEIAGRVQQILTDSRAHETSDAGADTRALVGEFWRQVKSGKPVSQAITWGLRGLDVAPLEPGTLHVLAARPRVGKTAAACSCAVLQAQSGLGSGIICIESPPALLVDRCLSIAADVPFAEVHARAPKAERHIAELGSACELLKSHLRFAGGRSMTVAGIRRQASAWKERDGIRCIYIDYAQNIRHAGAGEIRERVMRTVEELKGLSQDLAIPVILLSQLGRGAEDGVPQLAHLKESGALEEWADSVVLIDRPDAAQPEPAKRNYRHAGQPVGMTGRAAFIVAKNRNGQEGIHFVSFDGATMSFRMSAMPSETVRDVTEPRRFGDDD
jgi:replicative DNA helicase